MTMLPEAGIGEEVAAAPLAPAAPLAAAVQGVAPAPGCGIVQRLRSLVSERFSYALADQIVFSFGNVAIAAFVSRYCAPREFGIYILTQRVLDIINQLSNVLLWAPFMFNLPAMEKPRQRSYLGSIVAQQIVLCLLAAMLLRGLAGWAATPSRGLYYGVFAPLVVTSLAIVFREFTRRMYFAEMRMKEAFWTDVVTNGLQILGVWWLWRTHRLSVAGALWSLAAGAIFVSLWWLLREWSTWTIQLRSVVADLRLNVRLGKWFLGSNMVFTVSAQCNPWILSTVLGATGVAAYAICEQVVNIPRVALISIQNIMAPMLARAQAEGGKPALKRIVRRLDLILFGGSALFALGILGFGPFAAQLIFKHFPQNGRVILVVLALNLVVYAATMAQSFGLSAVGRADRTLYAQLAGLTAQVAVSYWLVRAFALPGAAVALLVGSAVVLVVRQIFYTREMRLA